jgi:hypothetical protein
MLLPPVWATAGREALSSASACPGKKAPAASAERKKAPAKKITLPHRIILCMDKTSSLIAIYVVSFISGKYYNTQKQPAKVKAFIDKKGQKIYIQWCVKGERPKAGQPMEGC